MKKLLMLAAAAAAILPMTAQAADTAAGTVTLNASAAPTCAIRQITRGGRGEGTYTPSTLSATGTASAEAILDFTSMLMNQTNATIQTVTEQDLYLNAFCNYANHNVSLKSQNGGLTNKTGTSVDPRSTFNQRIPYTAQIRDWGSGTNSGAKAVLPATGTLTSRDSIPVTSDPSLVQVAVNSIGDNLASIRIETEADSSKPLLQGTYEDVLTIRLGAAFPVSGS